MAGPASSEAPKPSSIDLRVTLRWSPPPAATNGTFVATVSIEFTCPWLPNGSSSTTKSLDCLKFYRCEKLAVRKKGDEKKEFSVCTFRIATYVCATSKTGNCFLVCGNPQEDDRS